MIFCLFCVRRSLPPRNGHKQVVLWVAVVLLQAWAISSGSFAGDAKEGDGETSSKTPAVGIATLLPPAGARFETKDSLVCDIDPSADAQACLTGLRWPLAEFSVDVEASDASSIDKTAYDRIIYFPSPHPVGNAIHDRVSMEWYAAKDEAGEPIRAPAVVVVHESGRSMPVGRIIARGLRARGLHAMLIHLPGYGKRRTELSDRPEMILSSLRQGIADVRRARDAVAALPLIDAQRIGVQGTSLGGFVTSTVVGLDDGFDRGFILLAGGGLDQVVLTGKKDAAKIREKLAAIGITDEQISDLSRPIEPLRLAHRIRPTQTWLYNGMFDDVVPPSSSHALATAARLPASHHIEMPANHYTGIIFLPVVLKQIHDAMMQ